MEIDLSIFFQEPENKVKALLTIEPLAPLSMVSTMPGSFYKTLSEPSKYHLCGAFENALGWHFNENIRREIRKKVDSLYKKQKKQPLVWENSEVGYQPLIKHLFDIEPNPFILKTPKIYYKDLWKQQRKRADGYSHPNGTINLSYELIAQKLSLDRDPKKGTVTNDAITKFYTENRNKYPMYYSSAGTREFVVLKEGFYCYSLLIVENLFVALHKAFSENNIAYLGTNEGWVNFKINRL